MKNVVKLVDYQKPEPVSGIDLSKCTVRRNTVHFLKTNTGAVKPPVQQHNSLPYHVVISGMLFVCSMVAVGATLLGLN